MLRLLVLPALLLAAAGIAAATQEARGAPRPRLLQDRRLPPQLDRGRDRRREDALLDFAGCVVVISHDRWFLDRIATHILAFEGNSEVVWHEGNYQSYIEDLKRRKGPDADQPHRVAYRKLVRA
jgi:hypothetical protein